MGYRVFSVLLPLACVSIGITGCNGQVFTEGAFPTLVSIVAEPGGANCPDGGSKVSSGMDNGQGGGSAADGLLAPGEATSTTYICNGAPGGLGANGTNGLDGTAGVDGVHGSNGADGLPGGNGADGLPGSNGADGLPGSDGADGLPGGSGAAGHNGLVVMTSVDPGDDYCVTGGQRIDVGVDDGSGVGSVSDDSILQTGEIDSTAMVCNGANGNNGSNGSDGFNSVLRVLAEGVGTHCSVAGFRIDAGLDNGDGLDGVAADGVLQNGEVDTTAYLCKPVGFAGVLAFGGAYSYSGAVLSIDLGTNAVTTLLQSSNTYPTFVQARGGAVAYGGQGQTSFTTARFGESDYAIPYTSFYDGRRVAVNGSDIALASGNTGSWNIVVGDYVTGVYTQITSNTNSSGVDFPAVDRDGDAVVYMRFTTPETYEIVAYNRATALETTIGPGFDPHVSGSRVVYTVDNSVVVYDLVGTTSRTISTGLSGYPSNVGIDGRFASFTMSGELYVYDLDLATRLDVATTNRARLADGHLVWITPDGHSVDIYNTATGVVTQPLHDDNVYFDFTGGP